MENCKPCQMGAAVLALLAAGFLLYIGLDTLSGGRLGQAGAKLASVTEISDDGAA